MVYDNLTIWMRIMLGDLGRIIFAVLVILGILLAAITTIDLVFETSKASNFNTILTSNFIFVFSSLALMIFVFVFSMRLEGLFRSYFDSDTALNVFNLIVDCILMFFLKTYLISSNSLIFTYPYLIILANLLLMLIPPYIAYAALRSYGGGFKN